MESPDLNSSPLGGPAEDPVIEAWLRTPLAPLPDAGFSQRVLAALPPPRPELSPVRTLACAVGVLAGLALAWKGLEQANDPGAHAWSNQLVELRAAWTILDDPTTAMGLSVAAGLTLITLIYAFQAPRWSRG